MSEGRIFKAVSGFYYVNSDDNLIECKARGRFRLEKNSPLVGDRVEYIATEPGRGYITGIFPRKNEFKRPLVSNIDKIVIVASGAVPVTDSFLIDTMTAIAANNGCESVICINKHDLSPAEELYDTYRSAGFITVRTSAKTGEGIDELLIAIGDSVCAFTGNSGVGKSSILNRFSEGLHIPVGEISKKLGRGRHTTRHVELFSLPSGAVIADTPGFSAFYNEAGRVAPKDEIQNLFPEFAELIGSCRFPDCAHINEPGCAILLSLSCGGLKQSRYSSYRRLYEQAKAYREWENKFN